MMKVEVRQKRRSSTTLWNNEAGRVWESGPHFLEVCAAGVIFL